MHGRGLAAGPLPGRLLRRQAGTEGLKLHGPGHNFDGSQYYIYKNGVMRCGMVSFQYQLDGYQPGRRRLLLRPGQPQGELSLPAGDPGVRGGRRWSSTTSRARRATCSSSTRPRPTAPCPGGQTHERRTLMYRFSPKYLHFAGGYLPARVPGVGRGADRGAARRAGAALHLQPPAHRAGRGDGGAARAASSRDGVVDDEADGRAGRALSSTRVT